MADKFLFSVKLYDENNLIGDTEVYEQEGTEGIYSITNGVKTFACPYAKACHNVFYCKRKLLKEEIEFPEHFSTFVPVNTEGSYSCMRNFGYKNSECEAKDIREYKDCEWYRKVDLNVSVRGSGR